MASARKDRNGYALRVGECQRCDGRYSYSYTDSNKKRNTVYAKTLAELRKRERAIIRDLEDSIDPRQADRMTLNDLFGRYMDGKYNLRETTKANYLYMFNHYVRPGFGKRKINTIKYTDLKKFYHDLLKSVGLKSSTLAKIHSLLYAAFQMAVREEILRINPANGILGEIRQSDIWQGKRSKHALTVPQQKAFVQFISTDSRCKGWETILIVLLGTGMRIGECLGLTWNDLDFTKRIIHVTHSFSDKPTTRGCERHVTQPKTRAGIRTIPMIDEVYEAFLAEREIQTFLRASSEVIDGYTDFVFRTYKGTVISPASLNRAISRIIDQYNEQEAAEAPKENREAVFLPKFSVHTLRHTFCTRLCENESNIKVIQSVMGHSDISTTMDIYAEATEEKKCEVMASLQGKIIV